MFNIKKYRISVTSMFADPLHEGHIECLNKIKDFSDYLFVLIDSDEKAIKKKGYFNIPQNTRLEVIRSLKMVDYAMIIETPVYIALSHLSKYIKIDCFCKGGDRTLDTIPKEEIEMCKKLGIEIVTGLGEKINSSSSMFKGVNNGKE